MIISSCLEYRIKTVAVVRIIQLVDPSYLFTLFTSQSVTNLAHSPNFVVTSMSDGFAQKKASRRAATKRKGRNEVDESLIIPGSRRRTQTYKARDGTTETDTPDPPAPQPKRPRVQPSLSTIQEQIDVFDGEIRVISPIDEEEDDFMPEVHPETLAHHHTFAEISDDSSESDRSAAPKPKKRRGRPPKATQPAPQVTLTTMNIRVPYLDGKEKAYAILYPLEVDKKKKAAVTDITFASSFLENIQTQRKSKKKSGPGIGNSRKQVEPVVDYFEDEDPGWGIQTQIHSANVNVGYDQRYKEAEEALNAKLRSCKAKDCGPRVLCALNYRNEHLELSLQTFRSWVEAIVDENQPDVSINKPPVNVIFKGLNFFSPEVIAATQGPSAPPIRHGSAHTVSRRAQSVPPPQTEAIGSHVTGQTHIHVYAAPPQSGNNPKISLTKSSSPPPELLEITPTVEEWLTNLQNSMTFSYTGWDNLKTKFRVEGSADMSISLLAAFSKEALGDGYNLNMWEKAVIFTELPKAAKSMGFRLNW
ncbi:hypothetical protein M422DRAFT_45982 [Sphaerobolus stellatus SS14]|uniref:Unplaced genomic scaffold SPHSTscaffold_30, whole genome shotgun sequence n=1 Tax=Sphaerobolus stellatus (strain SS14) TaxID=990650 RepID=A0A0C9W3V9_SPHS4|nr:hypothetical protein M422DRAFT_45982 [Sphaerobolus stellatus SS14]